MKEHHYAYKILAGKSDLVCSQSEFEADRMLDLLKDIKAESFQGIYWIFKQLNDGEKEPLCIIDSAQQRIYYHYSGEVESIDVTMNKLSRKI